MPKIYEFLLMKSKLSFLLADFHTSPERNIHRFIDNKLFVYTYILRFSLILCKMSLKGVIHQALSLLIVTLIRAKHTCQTNQKYTATKHELRRQDSVKAHTFRDKNEKKLQNDGGGTAILLTNIF